MTTPDEWAAPEAPGACAPPARPPLADPFFIGDVCIPNRVVLAPMAGLTSSAYRRHLKSHGAGLVTTEMVSAYGLLHSNVRTGGYLDFAEEERPIAVQILGDTPDVMARATERILSRAALPDVIDINMGCPVRKVVRTGAGAAFLADPERAVAVAGAVVHVAAQVGVPVTVKLRSGMKQGEKTVVGLAPRMEAAGVQGVTVHPRAADQFYRGAADHAITAAVARAVSIPVMASGDISSLATALAVYETTGAAALMAARGVAGDPWLVGALLSGRSAARPPLPVVVDDLRRLLSLAAAEQGPQRAARWIRKLLGWYLRPSGVPATVVERLWHLADSAVLDEALSALGAAGV